MPSGRATPGKALVDAYLAVVPEPLRGARERVRAAIRASAPAAEERISYKMPAFRLDGMLVYYGAFTDHGSLFVGGAETRRKLAKEIGPYETGTGTLHFTAEKPLPLALIRKVVRARVEENRARAKARASGKKPSRRRAA